jgi:hypothetical protein
MMNKKELWIYHPGTGTVIALDDVVYLVDTANLSDALYADMLDGASVTEREHMGWRIDNYNMTNLFFGGVE